MKMTQSWDFLLWCDPSNYGGIRCLTPKDDDTEKTNPLEEGDFLSFSYFFAYPDSKISVLYNYEFMKYGGITFSHHLCYQK